MATEGRSTARVEADGIGRTTIYSARLNCNAYLLELLNAGVWLLEHVRAGERRDRSVSIQLHPVGSPWIRWVRAFSDYSQVPRIARRYVLRWVHRVIDRVGSCGDRGGVTLIDCLRVIGSGARVQWDESAVIEMSRVQRGYAESLWPTLRAMWRAIRHWMRCREGGRMNVHAFLLSRYRGVQIGDLIASEVFRLNPTSGGSLRRCSLIGLLGGLTDAVYTVDYILDQAWAIHDESYVTTCETTYLEELYRRALKLLGCRILELQDYSGQLRVVEPDEDMPSPFVVRGLNGKRLSAYEQERTWRYLQGRLADAGKYLWYMYVGQNNGESGQVLDERGHVVVRDDRTLTVAIFLHSFDDAQYLFGLDGFEDLYEWTVVTIRECIGNPDIGRVLIKGHPNIDLDIFHGDKYAGNRLRDRFGREAKVQFIDPRTNVKALTSLGPVYGITNHGSVAEELVAVGLPVIASSKGPWGRNYPFLHLWDTPNEYVSLLRRLRLRDWRPPGKREQDTLAEYVHEYRLNMPPGDEMPVSLQWMVWKDRFIDVVGSDISAITEEQIAKLEADSPDLLNWLRDRETLYRGRVAGMRAVPTAPSQGDRAANG